MLQGCDGHDIVDDFVVATVFWLDIENNLKELDMHL
jgi:hypothetical protein